MTDAPERIFVTWPHMNATGLAFSSDAGRPGLRTEYTRADLPATDAQAMANPKVRALVSKDDGGAYRYLRHDGLCAWIGGYGYCSCGLHDALAAIKETGHE